MESGYKNKVSFNGNWQTSVFLCTVDIGMVLLLTVAVDDVDMEI